MKRTHQHFLSGESAINIKLPDAEALAADRFLLMAISSCARGLPVDAAEWDLSGLVVEGQPVSKAVVVAWLNCAYQCILDAPYEEQGKADISTVAGLAQLLAFADAVGSTGGVLKACLSGLDQLRLEAQLGKAVVELQLKRMFWWEDTLELYQDLEDIDTSVALANTEEEKASFIAQVAQQTEVLLYLAHKLGLNPLIIKLQDFIASNDPFTSSLLADVGSGNVFSRRVLQAAGSSELGQAAIIRNSLTVRGVLVPHKDAPWLLQPLNLTDGQKQRICFNAVVNTGFMGCRKGQHVNVELDLFENSRMRIGDAYIPVQLMLGAHYSQEEYATMVANAKQ